MNNDSFEFVDTSKECMDMMKKLSKQALKDGGKIVTKIMRNSVPVRTGGLKKSITAWAKIDKKTGQPYLEIGYRSKEQIKKRGVKYWVNPTWLEFGVKPHTIMTKAYKNSGSSSYQLEGEGRKFGVIVKHPGVASKNLLRNTVMNNIQEIVNAQQTRLAELNDMLIEKGMKINLGGDEEID